MSKNTSSVTLLSCVHGRDRRKLRNVEKRDLKAAIKYGTKEVQVCSRQGPHYGEIRFKYTFADTVYITDATSTQEITSYVLPLKIEQLDISNDEKLLHENFKNALKQHPHKVQSHIICILDQSGSMRTCDVDDFRTRSDLVFATLALDSLGNMIDSGKATGLDVASIIEMNEIATLQFDREPLTNCLYNKLIQRSESTCPRSHGCYSPALSLARKQAIKCPACAVFMFLLSDGRPSDPHHKEKMHETLRFLGAKFGKRFVFCGVGIGKAAGDFSILRRLCETVKPYAQGLFMGQASSSAQLSSTLLTITQTYSTLRDNVSALAGHEGRTLRPICRVEFSFQRSDADWHKCFRGVKIKRIERRWDPRIQHPGISYRRWRWVDGVSQSYDFARIRFLKQRFAEGAKRLVFKFNEVNSKGEAVGPILVAKDSRYLKNRDNEDFHRSFCVTQRKAAELADAFNSDVAKAR
eukprot:GHVN01009421.1.p1 GENE.GHVN01009421.1~~GHVN01009421.1.p1  ORF type:complete len:466 (+),score=27.29 GHVN01009421.1:149-1546(+)